MRLRRQWLRAGAAPLARPTPARRRWPTIEAADDPLIALANRPNGSLVLPVPDRVPSLARVKLTATDAVGNRQSIEKTVDQLGDELNAERGRKTRTAEEVD